MHGEEDTAAGYWMMMGPARGRVLAVAAAIAVAAYVAVTVAPSQASLRLQALGGSCGSFGDARGLLLSTPALHAPPASAKMNLYANLTFDVASAEGCTVAARYAPAESSLPPLWLSSDCSATSFALLRLRPSTFYDVALVVSVDGATTIEWRGAFETQGTGWAAFDEDRAPRRQRDEDHLGFDDPTSRARRPLLREIRPGTRRRRSKYNSTHNRTKEFDGLLAIDAEGYVVWYYHAWSLEAWDFLPDNGVVLVARDDGTKLDGAKTYRDDGRTYNGNSQLQEISPLGDIRKQFISACAGSPLNYNMVSHECRVDRATAKKGGAGAAAGVWTTRYAARRIPGVDLLWGTDDDGGYATVKADAFLGSQIARWTEAGLDQGSKRVIQRRFNVSLDVVYDLFDLAKPVAGSATPFVTKNWDDVDMWCSGNATMEGVEYHHASSGREKGANFSRPSFTRVVRVRRRRGERRRVADAQHDLVLAHDGSGAQWTLSSTLNASDAGVGDGGIWYAFEDDDEKFTTRTRRCSCPTATCSSSTTATTARAARRRTRPAATRGPSPTSSTRRRRKVRWQFEWPSARRQLQDRRLYNLVGGSAAALANGDYLVAFTSLDDTNKYDSRGTAFAFEVDVDGRSTVTTVAIPTPKADQDRQAAYRLVPWDSVGGETSVCPFLEAGSG
ncbi:hypothetical protein JL722_14756 [Aureococcus anophagefferens]|nr:hypothetical protein JL722_14756 [Aureococcus anophagefferens]